MKDQLVVSENFTITMTQVSFLPETRFNNDVCVILYLKVKIDGTNTKR